MLDNSAILWMIFATSILSLVFAGFLARYVIKKEPGDKKMHEISELIHNGAMTFLNKEYEIMLIFGVITACILFFLPEGVKLAISFAVGCVFSAVAGRIGMYIATKANVRTAWACKSDIGKGLKIAFSSGVVCGLVVVSLGVLGVSAFYYFFKDPNLIFGFGFGASYIALFARVGGGIYTKSADVGADLVGKVEKGIPEDDPRNPAVIADNVGDNVGDIAGMGADLFESYVESIVSAMVIGFIAFSAGTARDSHVILPLAISAVGIISSIIGMFFVRTSNKKHLTGAINNGIFISSALMAVGSFFVIKYMSGNEGIFYATIAGLVSGIAVGLATEYYTSSHQKPVKGISKAATTGAGTNVIEGLAVGMWSTIIPVVAVCIGMLASFYLAGGSADFKLGLYGVAVSAVGMLSTLAITLAADCYGPVADNAAGIAEMAKMGKEVREGAEALDAVGNTTAAIGKGFAIASAALTSLVLYVTFIEVLKTKGITIILDVTNPYVLVGLFVGGVLPFMFSSLMLRAVGKAAVQMVEEVRRQFKENKGIMSGKTKPDYNKCIAISTEGALKQMVLPGLLAVVLPLAIPLAFKWITNDPVPGLKVLGGILVGKTVVGFLLAVFMANSGGAWDNAKKYIEEGNYGGKGSDAHKAAVVGDTVGDPFKDTAGPALNILIKLMAIVALVFLPLFL